MDVLCEIHQWVQTSEDDADFWSGPCPFCRVKMLRRAEARVAELEKVYAEADTQIDELMAQLARANASVAELHKAIGLMSTAVPSMEIDVDDPAGMAQRVCARVAELEAKLQNTGMWLIEPDDPEFIGHAYRGKHGEVVVCGTPKHSDDDETGHNCDAMGCGFDHVLWRSGPGALGEIASDDAHAKAEG